MMRNFFNSTALFLCLFLATFTTHLYAQSANFVDPSIWEFANPDAAAKSNFIGNYPCLDLDDPTLWPSLQKISKKRSGTLFIVGKQLSPTRKPILQLGGLVLYEDSAFCAGQAIDLEPLNSKPFILKLKYQAGFKRQWKEDITTTSNSLDIAEIIYYDRLLSKEQSRVVESYLALKYSINITHNTENPLRNYLAIDSSVYWSYQADGTYDKEVFALGRLDMLGWNQTQTYTADSKSIAIGLVNELVLGNMPELSLADGSMVIISKRDWEDKKIDCGSAKSILPWKFRFLNWNANSDEIFVRWDTILDLQSEAYFTNGDKNIPLILGQNNGRTKLLIPLGELTDSDDQTWYLVWGNKQISCDPLVQFNQISCEEDASGLNRLEVNVDPKLLPASYTITDEKNKQSASGILNETSLQIDNIPAGQYHIEIHTSTQDLLDELVHFPICDDNESSSFGDIQFRQNSPTNNKFMTNNGEPKTETENSAIPISGDIELFPNPIEKGVSFSALFHSSLYDQEFEIKIIDKSGKIIMIENFTPDTKRDGFQKAIQSSGTYFIHFTGKNTKSIKRIVVQ